MQELGRSRPNGLRSKIESDKPRGAGNHVDEALDHPLSLSARDARTLNRRCRVGVANRWNDADLYRVGQLRVLHVLAGAIALAGFALFLANVHTSESAWRRLNPEGNEGRTIHIPAKKPARDAPGVEGWSWLAGTPGWRPGERIEGYPVAGLRAPEIRKAQQGADNVGADGAAARVLISLRTNDALIAILAAPMRADRTQTCLAAMLKRNTKVQWWCPDDPAETLDLSNAAVLVGAARLDWPNMSDAEDPLYLAGVARGDVRRVVLESPGSDPQTLTLYERGETWGQFEVARTVAGPVTLLVYGQAGLLETVHIDLKPGRNGIFR